MDAQAVSSTWKGLRVCVAGLGVSGRAAARVLAERGARVTVVEGRDDEALRGHAAELAARADAYGSPVTVRLGDGETLPDDIDLVVTSPGWRPDVPLLAAAARAGIEIIGEVELAWRLRRADAAPWLALTGTNGKTTAVRMLACILDAAGHRTLAVGNVGTPIVEAVLEKNDVLAVELSSYQLHWSSTVAPYAAAVLNVAPDHLDWHGSLEAYAADKGKIYAPGTIAVINSDDPVSVRLGGEGAIGFTLAVPQPGQLGVVEDLIVDRALVPDPEHEAVELAALADVRPFAPHNVANALAAAALARAFGVPPEAVQAGLREFVPDPHRIAHVATLAGVDYVDDSKATNPHAAASSLTACRSAVWIAGGQLKGADVDELVRSCADRLRAVVLLGADRAQIATALARHAPEVPVVDVPDTDTGAMDRVVSEASALAQPGDTVLLAPAGASFDMFTSYGARGDAFAAAVRRLAERR
ncbi:UDP-N-acetylmuramoyl-L-alanine--D-glutamate ligase [Actinomadura rudentiformis]|uniref:UDP-N-acetylmuramoylalanine--D-glutamate ligase n=1 Tax=Actinomadura rudentiformis TaxID=359158 RepID=A0A6H9YS90_9ACTN|nr:UDP-N-acetylmuramoyl-L-alanine--D-glutamate ligase [Actinomadura rudentiformis]KAB2343102.1 UDP-N-acetylmuramoyl-L-alanine--D-glutamate ligase [Actinomadura rudentiformis]